MQLSEIESELELKKIKPLNYSSKGLVKNYSEREMEFSSNEDIENSQTSSNSEIHLEERSFEGTDSKDEESNETGESQTQIPDSKIKSKTSPRPEIRNQKSVLEIKLSKKEEKLGKNGFGNDQNRNWTNQSEKNKNAIYEPDQSDTKESCLQSEEEQIFSKYLPIMQKLRPLKQKK